MSSTFKNQLRFQIKSRLERLVATGDFDRLSLAKGIEENLFALLVVRQAQTIMTYLSLRTEAPTWELIQSLFSRDISNDQKRTVVVPWCRDKEIELYRLDRSSAIPYFPDLVCGKFGIYEPDDRSRNRPEHRIHRNELDVVLVPGVAFDRHRQRLGRGAGYYDRFIASLSPKTVLIGIAFDEQLVESVPVESHDKPVDYVVTPGTIIY